MKNKTKVLLTSLATIAMSASLAVGGTYALFSSEDSVNIAVTSGTVKVSAKVTDVQTGYDKDVVSSANSSFVAEYSEEKVSLSGMLPGDYATVTVEIANESTVAVLYKVATKSEGALSEALEVTSESNTWSLWEETGTKTISLKIAFPDSEDVNEYNGGLSASVSVTVYAVQGNAEVSDDLPENVVPLYTKADLVEFAEAVNAGDTYKGKEVRLMSDINLAGIEWAPIGPNADAANKFFGTFDGQGYTISNLTVKQDAAYHAAGLFGALNGTVKNLTIDGATISSISSGDPTDNGTAVVAGSIYTSGAIDNVHVKNATVNGNRYVGGISGYTYGSVTNCSVENTKITATPDDLTGSYNNGDKVGGIAGYWASESVYKIEDNSVKNVTITGYRDLGGIVGYGDGVAMYNNANGVTIYVNNKHNYKGYTTLAEYDADAIVGDGTVDSSNTKLGYKVYLMEESVKVSNVEELASAIANANGAITIKLNAGDYEATQISIPSDKSVTLVRSEEGEDEAVLKAQLKVSGTLTLKGVTVNGPANAVEGISQYSKSAIALMNSGDVICENVTFNLNLKDSTAITAWWSTDDGANIECYDCTFNCNGNRPIRSDACVTVKNCTFNDPYRYAVQMTSKSSTMNEAAEAYVNFYNNTINAGDTSAEPVYGIQLEGGYGCSNLTINGAGNTINYGKTGKTGTMYYCECGAVEHETIVWNTGKDQPVHEEN